MAAEDQPMLRCAAVLLLATAALAGAPDEALTVAWVRFPAAAESYQGVPYHWLGQAGLRLTLDVPPATGQALWLRWGAKGDQRHALLLVGDQVIPVTGGGWDGFQWRRVELPAGLTGDRLTVALQPGIGKAAFLAEVRLTGATASPPRPDLAAPSFRATAESVRALRPDSFPAQRLLWAREPRVARPLANATAEAAFRQAERHGRLVNEMLYRCRRYAAGWLAQADPRSGLIPRNLGEGRDTWNAKDAAADNYPYLVLTAAICDRDLFDGRMREMLTAETRLTSRLDALPDDYSFSKQGFRAAQPNLEALVFGGSEYVKDGLLPLTEWLGPSPWSERALAILESCWRHAAIDTPFGKLPTLNVEVCGDQLQALSRLFWMTGDRRFLDWAIRLGDYYLLGTHHPTRDADELRLLDHGCEVVNGLTELYAAVATAAPAKRDAYRAPLHELFDRLLAIGRTDLGMLYSSLNPRAGTHSAGFCDTWGYTYDGFYTLWLLDGSTAYRDATRHVLANLPRLIDHDWRGADSYADSIEGAINLLQREPDPGAAAWIDSEIQDMWRGQRPDGIIEGWHGDGNVARTAIMHALQKSQGCRLAPWRDDLRVGAVRQDRRLLLSLAADHAWSGRVLFDGPRHREYLRLPLDYPRINQYPEWWTVTVDRTYRVSEADGSHARQLSGRDLRDGLPVSLRAGVELRWVVEERAGR